jgi:hypothetical protein
VDVAYGQHGVIESGTGHPGDAVDDGGPRFAARTGHRSMRIA